MSVRLRAGKGRWRARAAIAALTNPAAVLADRAGERSGSPEEESKGSLAQVMQRDHSDFQHMRRLLAFTLGPSDSGIDVGAHRGAVLAEMARVAPAGRHVAFEPIPELAKLLEARFPSVEVHQSALSDHPGASQFAHVRGDAEGWSGLRFRPLPTGEQADVETIDVRLEALDDVLDPEHRPAVIKIDVEGAEQQVLQGATLTLRRHRPIVIFEHGSGSAETYGTSPRDIHEFFADEVDYRIFDLDGNGPYQLSEFERTFYAAERINFVARP